MTDELPDDVSFRSLGRRRLRGFPRPDVIYQAQVPDLPKKFPRLRTSI
jgi:class 3 adenylate cyclase